MQRSGTCMVLKNKQNKNNNKSLNDWSDIKFLSDPDLNTETFI